MNPLKRLFGSRSRAQPSPHDLMVRKWYAEGGDYGLRFNYQFNRDSVVLDIGGFEGQWASDLYARSPCQISVFEPVKSYADRIAKRFVNNSDINVYPFGLGAKSRSEDIVLAGDATSTIREQAGARERIQIQSINEWVNERVPVGKNIALMKVNIEGGEFELLPAVLDSGLIARIECLQIQFHDVSPTSAEEVRRIRSSLSKTHRSIYQYDFVWDDWRVMDAK